MAIHYVHTSHLKEQIPNINAGDEVYLSGTIYTARDAAHKKILSLIQSSSPLPFELSGSVIYYAGPTPEKEGQIIGSCGPTTSSRMDSFTPIFMDKGQLGMIGKGPRNHEVVKAIKRNGGIYFCAIGGAGALCAMSVKKYEVIAFEDLGCESVKRMEIENFPLLCGIDCKGKSIFKKGTEHEA